MKNDITSLHTFVVCAYGNSEYLQECLESLLTQKLRSRVYISAAVESDFLYRIAEKYHVPLFLRNGEADLAEDWNFALSLVKTPLVTLAHQDDVYLADYSRGILEGYRMSRRLGQDPIILFTDYEELRERERVTDSNLLKVKHLLLAPLKRPELWSSRFVRRRILSMGSAICCPAVTLCRERLQGPLFHGNMQSNIDWQAWEELSRLDGAFVYWARPLMLHRLHEESTTNRLLRNAERRNEDLYMFRKFWPEDIAKIIERVYRLNESSAKV